MSNKVSDFKLNKDIENYKRMGLDERTSVIVACSVNGVPEKATEILSELGDEQAELRKCLNEMIEFSKLLCDKDTLISSDIVEENVKNEEPNTECKLGEQY